MADPVLVAAIGLVTASLGYVGTLAGRMIDDMILRRSIRESSLIELQSYLLASQAANFAQRNIRNELAATLRTDFPHHAKLGYDALFAACFPKMTGEQKRTHGLIRAYTVDALRPMNQSMSTWLGKDREFKHQTDTLGLALQALEAHLTLWHAKYAFWIPDHPERALVYLADEENHGVGFPVGIEELVVARTSGGKSKAEKYDRKR